MSPQFESFPIYNKTIFFKIDMTDIEKPFKEKNHRIYLPDESSKPSLWFYEACRGCKGDSALTTKHRFSVPHDTIFLWTMNAPDFM